MNLVFHIRSPDINRTILRAIVDAVDSDLARGAQTIARDMRRDAPKAFSILTNAITVLRNSTSNYTVAARTDYASMVDRGTGPGGAPSDQSLADWIRAKRISPRDPGMDMEDMVYLIGRAIRTRGIQAQPFAERSLERNAPEILDHVRSSIARVLQ